MATPGAWALLAEIAGEPAGHVALLPPRGDESRTAHLWQLFVRPAWLGSGLAGALHEAFEQRARERGHTQAALRTPAAHTRARAGSTLAADGAWTARRSGCPSCRSRW